MSQRTEEQICADCRFLPTKPESVPDQFAGAIASAWHLAELKESGAVFDYPKALSLLEWQTLTSYNRGKNQAQNKQYERERKEAKKRG